MLQPSLCLYRATISPHISTHSAYLDLFHFLSMKIRLLLLLERFCHNQRMFNHSFSLLGGTRFSKWKRVPDKQWIMFNVSMSHAKSVFIWQSYSPPPSTLQNCTLTLHSNVTFAILKSSLDPSKVCFSLHLINGYLLF